MLQVHFLTNPAAPLLKLLTTQQTDQQYSYYAKNVRGCLSNEILCVDHDTLIGLRVGPVFQNTHMKKNHSAHKLASNTEFRQLHCFKTLQS